MHRTPPRKTTEIQTHTPPAPALTADEGAAPVPSPQPSRLGLGWKIAIAVWLAGFFGLLLVELSGLVWKLLSRSSGG